jgi:hypothetical protein
MQTARDRLPFYIAASLSALAVGLVAFAAVGSIAREILEVIMMIAGAVFVAALSAWSRFLDQNPSAPLIQISFNDARLRDELTEVQDAEFVEIPPADSWEPTTDKLLVQDPVLALAKVRIDLEREIRRIGLERGIIRSDQRMGLQRAVALLEERGVLPQPVLRAVNEILPLCTAAIHGAEVSVETARKVVDIAREVMQILRTITRNAGRSEMR